MRKLIFLTAGLLIPALVMAQLHVEWISSYNSPYGASAERGQAVAIDVNGYVYASGYGTGPSGENYDYITIKYDRVTGEPLWVRYYNGPDDLNDHAVAVKLDGSTPPNVYVTGYSHGSATGSDYATIKYNSNGVQQWVARYNGPPGDGYDSATALAVDAAGNSYVTGSSWNSETNTYDFATVKYNPDGDELWVTRYHRVRDFPKAIAVDGSGNSYVTGTSGWSTYFDITTVKYDPDGVQQWEALYNNPPGNWIAGGNAIVVDGAGNSYVAGYSPSLPSGTEFTTVKYDPDGNELWAACYEGPTEDLSDAAKGIALDGVGGVYVAGTVNCHCSPPSQWWQYDYAAVKYDANGTEQWVAQYDGVGRELHDYAQGVAVDNAGVYVTGYSDNIGRHPDYATLMYDRATGTELDCQRYSGPGGREDGAFSIACNGKGAVAVTGLSNVLGEYLNIVTIKYSHPTAIDAAVDLDPNKLNLKSKGKWVTGYIEFPEEFSVEEIDLSTVAISAIDDDLLDPPLYREGPTEIGDYDLDGVSDLMVKFDRQRLVDVLIDMGYGDGDEPELTVTGGLVGDTTFKGADTIELVDKKDGGQSEATDLPERISIQQTSPNPFRLATSLRYGLPAATHVRLEIYSPTGQRVTTLVDRVEGAGYHNATWNGRDDAGRELAAGIYLCRFEAGTYKTTRKTQLLR